jgi:hypothetical protein
MDESRECGVMYLRGLINGGIITKPDVALKIPEILIVATHSVADLEQQKPLKVIKPIDGL